MPDLLCKHKLVAVVLIILVGTIIYSNTFQVPFVFDDQHSIVENIAVKKPDNVFYGYKMGYSFIKNRLIAYLTFALNYQFGGLNVTGYHVVNLLIHLATALLTYCLLRLTFRTPHFVNTETESPTAKFKSSSYCFIPLFTALLFVAHPVQTQAVTYVVQRMASLATMFFLLSMVLFVFARLRMTEESNAAQHNKRCLFSIVGFYVGSVLAALLAMKTKEIAFTLPLAIVLYEIFFFRGVWFRRFLYLCPILATLPVIPLTILGFLDFGVDKDLAAEWQIEEQEEPLRVQTEMSRLDYLFTQFRVIVTYLRLMFFPVNQNIDYDYPVLQTFATPPVFLSFLLLTSILILAVCLYGYSAQTKVSSHQESRPTLRLVSYGIIWFFLTLAVESSFVPIKDVIMEHRLYLPFFGAATAFATGFYLLMKKITGISSSKLMYLAALALVLVLGITTYKRNNVWGDPIRLWQDTVTKSPGKARPLNNLGKALEESGKRNEAFDAFSKAIQLDPSYYRSYYNLADLYLVSDQPEAALQLLQAALKIRPDFTEAYVSMGAALMRSGQFREVVIFLEKNLNRIADKAEARFYLGAAYAFTGNREKALRELSVLSQLDPSYAANLRGMINMSPGGTSPHGQR